MTARTRGKKAAGLGDGKSQVAASSAIAFRSYTPKDEPSCVRIAGRSVDYTHALDLAADVIEVAEIDGTVVGFAFLQIWDWSRVGWLGEIVVDPDCRHLGIGTKLLSHMEVRARQRGCRVVMDHPPVNHPAIPFYLARGYRICGYNDAFYDGDNRTAIFIAKEL